MLLECVPNFSEGRDALVLQDIAETIRGVPGVVLLGMDSGPTANRTVVTFAGPPEPVCEAAFLAIQTAAERIDMRKHQGAHPRIGATDVCPLVPLLDVTMAQAVAFARRLAKRAGEALSIPIYLYGHAATSPSRKHLSAIRRGGYEGLASRMRAAEGNPDFGPGTFQPGPGATVIGARDLMIAYNINLAPGHLKLAKSIAGKIRESGQRTSEDKNPGLFRGLKAIGWHLERENWTQVSTNIMDIAAAPIHEVYEAVKSLAKEQGVAVAGSELVGLIPRTPLLDAGRYYQKRHPGRFDNPIQAAVEGLGLNHAKPFHPQLHILEESLQLPQSLLISHESRD